MNKFFAAFSKFAAVFALFAALCPAFAQKFFTLDAPLPGPKIAITEVLNYRCSHCFSHHQNATLAALSAAAGGAQTRYLQPLAGGSKAAQIACALAYAEAADAHEGRGAASKNSLSHRLLGAVFAEEFLQAAEANLPQILTLSPEVLQDFCASGAAQGALQAAEAANEIMRRYGTPAFVINNKYLINISQINSLQELQDLVKTLLLKD